MGSGRLTREVYRSVAETVRTKGGGDVSYAARERKQRGEGISPYVDPKGFGLIRRSLPRCEQRADGLWQLLVGKPMALETRFDTTGSMGGNVRLAFNALPNTYDLVSQVLSRYDVHIMNSIFQDVVDEVVLYRSCFEMAGKIAEQLTLMIPESAGGDSPEDPEYGFFAGAYLTAAHICGYGLKTYDLTVTDVDSHGRIDHKNLVRVFGDGVYDVVGENGYTINKNQLPRTHELIKALKAHAHAFMLLVEPHRFVVQYWADIYGEEYVIQAPTTQHLHYYQAGLIGLTEGTLDLQSAVDFLKDNGATDTLAREIVRSMEHIPLGAQQEAEHFMDIPLKGAVFKEKTDLWPVDPGELKNVDVLTSTEGGEEGLVWD